MSMLYLSGARLSISSTDVIQCDNGYNGRITVVVSTHPRTAESLKRRECVLWKLLMTPKDVF
jgi:hypothetical protein